MRGRARAVLLVVVAGLVLAGCGSGAYQPTQEQSAVLLAPMSNATGDRNMPFGATYTTRDGQWVVRTSTPKPYRRSEYASGGEQADRMMRVDITLTNRTGRYADAMRAWLYQIGVDGSTADEVFDTQNNVQGTQVSGSIAPNKPFTFGVVWALGAAPGTLQLKIGPPNDPKGQSLLLFSGRA